MKLYDCHVHSNCSEDGYISMSEIVKLSYQRGVRHLCFTDHCDMDDIHSFKFRPDCFDLWKRAIPEFEKAKKISPPGMELRLGIELGAAHRYPEMAKKIVSIPELDFVLGSLHVIKDTTDFYYIDYKSHEHCARLMDRYADELIEIAEQGLFDCMAHIGYTVRYMRRAGFNVSFGVKDYGDKIERLLKTIIENGKGIEINCSGFRMERLLEPTPTIDVLRLYKELGGEIITIGSDGHAPQDMAAMLKEGMDCLSDLGFKYISVYDKRKPRFIKI